MNHRRTFESVDGQSLEKGMTPMGQKYEVVLENGIKVLNSEHANYSFGSLHSIMQKGIEDVLRHLKPASILMLGLGAGSALAVLENKCRWAYRVTAVEVDEGLIKLAERHFGLKHHQNLQVICGDAEEVIGKLPASGFDLIIDDVFMDNRIPAFCKSEGFLTGNRELLSGSGVYMRNFMGSEAEAEVHEHALSAVFASVRTVKDKTYGNRIFFCGRS